MDRKQFRKSLSLTIALIMAVSMFCMSFTFVCAESGIEEASVESVSYTYDIPELMWKGQNKAPVSVTASDKSKVTVKNVESSNKKIVEVVKSGKMYLLKAKKEGSASITVTYKLKNGTSGRHTAITTIKNYPNQIKSLKIDGKAVTISKHKYSYIKSKNYKNTKVKIQLALNNGWDITSAWGYLYKGSKQVNISKSMLISGKTIKFPKKYKRLYVSIFMRNGLGEIIRYDVDLNR